VGFVLGGFTILIIKSHTDFKLEEKLTLGDVTTSCTALLVALLVTHYLEKHNTREKKEKELLSRQLEYTEKLVQDFEKANEEGEIPAIASAVKRLRTSNQTFLTSLQDLKYPHHLIEKSKLDELLTEVKKLATDTPIHSIEKGVKKSNCDVTVKDNIIKLTMERKNLLDVRITDLKQRIFRTQIEINKY
jgi:hypothetical protein